MKRVKTTGLSNAYGLSSKEDNQKLYAEWAATYDTSFGQAMDYAFPDHVAEAYFKSGQTGRVLDVGAGTGLVAERLLTRAPYNIDATDISPEMLAVAKVKNIYRNLFVGDMTASLPVADGTYDGVVCAGTYTKGHLGPETLDELIRIAQSGAMFAISINLEHFRATGFAEKFQGLENAITDLNLKEVQIYGDGATGDHAQDRGFIATFRKRSH